MRARDPFLGVLHDRFGCFLTIDIIAPAIPDDERGARGWDDLVEEEQLILGAGSSETAIRHRHRCEVLGAAFPFPENTAAHHQNAAGGRRGCGGQLGDVRDLFLFRGRRAWLGGVSRNNGDKQGGEDRSGGVLDVHTGWKNARESKKYCRSATGGCKGF